MITLRARSNLDQQSWVLVLYRLQNNLLVQVGTPIPGVSSLIFPLDLRLLSNALRPKIEVRQGGSEQIRII